MGDHYKVWRATTEPSLHVLVLAGIEHFDGLPDRVRRMGPWQGAQEGDLDALRPHYRALLAEQGFAVLDWRLDLVQLER